MATYAIWNNKGGVGKSYLTFQIACEYARTHPEQKVLVVDVCPQANSSSMLLGGMVKGEKALEALGSSNPRSTIAGYIRERINSPYHNPRTGGNYVVQVQKYNKKVPANVYLVPGDGELEVLGSRVTNATRPGPDDAWVKVHRWLADLIEDIRCAWNQDTITAFVDCNPSFSIYTELALSASDRLMIPFSADGSSKRAVGTVLSLLYGITRPGGEKSEFFLEAVRWKMVVPKIYCYIGNRMTQANYASAKAFHAVVTEIGNAIWGAWNQNATNFVVHPPGTGTPKTRAAFTEMFQIEIVDANTASVVSSSLGIPLVALTAGNIKLTDKAVTVNQSQLGKQQPNIRKLVEMIE